MLGSDLNLGKGWECDVGEVITLRKLRLKL